MRINAEKKNNSNAKSILFQGSSPYQVLSLWPIFLIGDFIPFRIGAVAICLSKVTNFSWTVSWDFSSDRRKIRGKLSLVHRQTLQEPKQRDTIPSMTHFHNIHTWEIMSKTQEELFYDIKQTFLYHTRLILVIQSWL